MQPRTLRVCCIGTQSVSGGVTTQSVGTIKGAVFADRDKSSKNKKPAIAGGFLVRPNEI
jgi:hypothetical protein